MPTVDNLDIEISASVSKANASLDLLVKRLGKVSASLSGVNTRGIATMASGVNKLANAMNNFSNNTNTAVFTRLTRNLNSLGNIDQRAIANASKSLGKIAGAMKVFNNINVSGNAKQLGDLAKGISQLGYASATKAINNIPQLATAMRNLMQTLSTAPRVSQNIIDMTNALAKLARTGASSGRAANSLSKSLSLYSKSTIGAKRNSLSLAGAIGKVYATYWLLFRAFGKIREAIDISSGLQEVQNVIDVTFGDFKQKVEDLAKVSITDFGMSELTAKQIAGRFQAMGTAMGIAQGKMSDMSIELTKLSADMASFYNVAQEDVARSLQSVFTGEAEPLRKYGVDLTQATLKTFALSQGLNSNVEAMTQAEKTMLRYQYVMHATGAAQGDFARTSNNWANQIRILKGNFQELAGIIGTSFINALKPLVQALNSAMRAIINFAKVVSNSLGKIFGWQYEETGGGVTADMEGASEYADDLASGTGKAANNAKKLKQQLQGIDELNVLTTPSDTSGSGGSGGGGGGTATEDANVGQWTKTDGLLKDYESQLDTLYKLGEEIGNKLTQAMNNIDWDSVYQGARDFGSGLAEFLNGLISPELFGATGETIASALNTAIYSALSFGETFDWKDLGESISSGINNFFQTFDSRALAETINTWIKGALDTVSTLFKQTDFELIGEKIGSFLSELDLSEWISSIGDVVWRAIKSAFELLDGLIEEAPLETALITAFSVLKFTGLGSALASKISSAMSTYLAVNGITLPSLKSVAVKLGLSIAVAIVGYKIGEKLYEKLTGEDAIGSLGDLIDMDISWEEVGKAISEGAVVEITLTPLIKAITGDDSITTEEVNEALAEIIEDADTQGTYQVSIGAKLGTTVNEFILKIRDFQEGVQNLLFTTAYNAIKLGIELIGDPQKFYEEKLKPFLEKIPGLSTVLDIVGKITKTEDEVPKDEKKIGGFSSIVSKFTDKITGSNKKLSPFTANVSKTSDKRKDSKYKRLPFTGNIKLDKNSFDGLKGLRAQIQAAFTSGQSSYTFKDSNGKVHTIYKKDGGIFKNGRWHDIAQYASGGYPNSGQMFIAREAGPELVGRIGNSTAVLNNDQIVSSVSAGVYQAVRSAMSETQGSSNVVFEVQGDPNGMFRVMQKQSNDYKRRTGKLAFT